MVKKRVYKRPTKKRMYVRDKKTGVKRRINQKLSRAMLKSPKVRRRRGKHLKAQQKMKIGKGVKKARRLKRTKSGRKVFFLKKAKPVMKMTG